ncbi:hypothetical protein CKO51_13290 [Rhodopirellula sp. SM50]|nr:hypothetical protein [Rhodopirellula sp. SM50]PAY19097.1 hypothetical protein CKO51_13290 [Rhodopirellula sp. SM50]
MFFLSEQSRFHLAALTDIIVAVEKSLASMPGSRHSSCACELDEHADYFKDDPSDRVCLRFGRIRNHPGECLHVEVSDETGEISYAVWICDKLLPDLIRIAVASRAPRLIRLAATDADEVDVELIRNTAIAAIKASRELFQPAHPRPVLW